MFSPQTLFVIPELSPTNITVEKIKGVMMTDEMLAEAEEKLFNDLRDEPCIVCGDPYMYVLGSYTPEQPSGAPKRVDKVPVLYYTLCQNCFNNGRIPTARIEAVYRRKFGKIAA
ncbi:MAG: hypothetical protein PVH74_00765 [Desulfobacterales bacterium]|jgi:hypothetical protein